MLDCFFKKGKDQFFPMNVKHIYKEHICFLSKKRLKKRTHLFVGLRRNVYGFRVGHFSNLSNLIDLKFVLLNPTHSSKNQPNQ